MAVTKEQILAAADQIAAAGERPTLEAVRQIVGGSYTTISPVLNEWKARQKEATAPLRRAGYDNLRRRAVTGGGAKMLLAGRALWRLWRLERAPESAFAADGDGREATPVRLAGA